MLGVIKTYTCLLFNCECNLHHSVIHQHNSESDWCFRACFAVFQDNSQSICLRLCNSIFLIWCNLYWVTSFSLNRTALWNILWLLCWLLEHIIGFNWRGAKLLCVLSCPVTTFCCSRSSNLLESDKHCCCKCGSPLCWRRTGKQYKNLLSQF